MYFELPYLPQKPVFRKRDLLRWKAPASLSLFVKSEKIPALLYIGRGPTNRPFCDLRSVPEAQITEGRVLRLFSYNSCTNRKIGKNYLRVKSPKPIILFNQSIAVIVLHIVQCLFASIGTCVQWYLI